MATRVRGGLYRLENTIQEYAWGSRTFLAGLLGATTPSERPQAELWMGAHPAAPSRIVINGRPVALDALLQESPLPILGRRVTGAFDGRLPFLMKILAADHPLSIQAHPNKEQARRGWARDNARGLAPDSPERSYRDASHKPEIMAPLVDLWALHGFRRSEEALDQIRMLSLPEGDWMAETLRSGGSLALLERLLTLDPARRADLVDRAAALAPLRLSEPVGSWIARLAAEYPGDAGALAPLFLNLVLVPPGSALYLGPGQPHAYLRGAGVELMANSDNVLRGGLTPKKVDVAELVKVLDPGVPPLEPLTPRRLDTGEETWVTPAREFRLSRLTLRGGDVFHRPADQAETPEIHVVVRGRAALDAPGCAGVEMEPGRSCLVTADVSDWTLRGDAVVYRSRVP